MVFVATLLFYVHYSFYSWNILEIIFAKQSAIHHQHQELKSELLFKSNVVSERNIIITIIQRMKLNHIFEMYCNL